MRRSRRLITFVVALLLLILALNFLNFRFARSNTRTNAGLSTYRMGETLPANMSPGFTLAYTVSGSDPLSTAVAAALPEVLAATTVGRTTAVPDLDEVTGPALLVMVEVEQRLWTPIYGRAAVTATAYFAYDGEAPWPLDEAVQLQESPAVKADGNFTVRDTTWGLLSRPAYNAHLAEALAQEIAGGLQRDVFRSQ